MLQNIIEIFFPGGKKVDAAIGNLVIQSDQSKENGGEGSAPEPLQLFMASLATCAGVYALGFCRTRAIATEGLGITMISEWDENKKLYTKINIELKLPKGFPEKYRTAMIKAVDQCTVKRHLISPPEFRIKLL